MTLLSKLMKSKDKLDTPIRLICFDFDGVIHSYTSGWKGFGDIPDLPVIGSKDIMTNLVLTPNVKLVIFSCRNKSFRGRKAMKKYLLDQVGLSPVIANQIRFPWFKPAALVALDDRSLLFEGIYPSIETLLNFKPWNKQSV